MEKPNEVSHPPEVGSGDGSTGDVHEKRDYIYSQDKDTQNSSSDIDSNTGGLAGVEKIEATTKTWTTPWLVAAYIFVWLIFFTDSLQQQISGSLLPYVTSSFGFHGLLATTSIVSNIVAGVSKLPLARIIDVVGRVEGFLIMLFMVVLALILMASCVNIETYAAAQVFFWTGMNGIGYVLNVFLADTSSLKNRAILFAFSTTPYISNTFAGPAAAQAFLEGSTWRWGYGSFTIITPIMCLPFIVIFTVQLNRARQAGHYKKEKSGRTFMQSVWYWLIEFDVAGMILIVAGFSLFLLPFSLATYQADKWRSGTVISMIVIGCICLIVFPFYEKYIAPKSFIPYDLFKNRTVLAACLLGGNLWISFYCYKMYFSSYLQVVFNVSVSRAGFILNIFNIVSCAWAVPVGVLMRVTDRYKWLGYVMVPVYILFTGLMIKFRMPGTDIGLVIMCEVFNAFAGGTLVLVEQMGVMANVPHRDVAVGLALLSLVTSVGGAIGQSISGAIWTNTLPGKLASYLPEELKADAATIYGDLTVQLSYEPGSPAREAIIRAYGETQKLMIIASIVALVGPLLWVYMMKNTRLSSNQQTKGLVF